MPEKTAQLGTIEKHEFYTVFGQTAELQARKIADGKYKAEWSFDGGQTWNMLMRIYDDADEAITFAGCGAFIAHVHNVKLKERGE